MAQKKFFSLIKGAKEPPNTSHQNRITPQALCRCSTQEARTFLDYELAQKLNVLPLGIIRLDDKDILSFASSHVNDVSLLSSLRFATGKNIKLIPVDIEVLKQAIFLAYKGDQNSLEASVQELKGVGSGNGAALRLSPSFRGSSGEVSSFICSLIDYAISKGASDIHITPESMGSSLKLRLDGELYSHENTICSLQVHHQLITRLKVLANLDTTIKHLPQDGSFKVPINETQAHVRLSSMPTVYGEKIVLRLLGSGGLIPIENLGLDNNSLQAITRITERTEGAILFAGPTGSGKSTTMYSVLAMLKNKNLNLVTVEDPVEVQIPGVSQTSINPKVGLDYPTALRSILRQDPDVLLLGEIRDPESAKIAIQASLTGHLVLSTVHGKNIPDVFLRLRSFGIDDLSVSSALNLIVSQRLLPRLCDRCKVIDLEGSEIERFEVYKPAGCKDCDYSGFHGRILASESLMIDEDISFKIALGKNPALSFKEATQRSQTNGEVGIKGSITRLLKAGLITRD